MLIKESEILISVIIPTYNRAEYLKKAIESVLIQTYQNFEILVCDDGSTDLSKRVVENFDDSRIYWYIAENSGGPATPRNKGIKEAKGEWIAFLYSDDIWISTKLERQIDTLKNHDVKMICTNANILRNNEVSLTPYFKNSSDKILTFENMVKVNSVICSSMMIHNFLIDNAERFPENEMFKTVEDYVLWLSLSMVSDILYLNESLTIYRDEPLQNIRSTAIDTERNRKKRVLWEVLKRPKRIKKNRGYFRLKLLYRLFKSR